MTAMTLNARLGKPVTIDVCAGCQAFWFDHFDSLQLSAGSTLKLMKFIGEHSSPGKPSLPDALHCPRCATTLRLAHNMQRNMPFTYWRCANDDGHFIGFFEFLKEKNFIHPLSPEQIKELRQNVQSVNCSNCGASINLESNSACPYCHSPISMLDMKQPQRMLEQLQQAAEPRPMDPALPMKLASAKLELETSLADDRIIQVRPREGGSGSVSDCGVNRRWPNCLYFPLKPRLSYGVQGAIGERDRAPMP